MSRDFRSLNARLARENILFSVLLELTYRCNLDCFYCYNDLSLEGRALSLEQYRQLLDDLAEMQVLNLILSGGEPLAHPHFFEIGGHAREKDFAVRIKSNGHALRGRLARRLKEEVDPFVVDISLHGARAETHDRQTRVPGSFQRLLGNLEELRGLGVRVKLNFTLTRWNEDEVEDVVDLVDSLGLYLGINTTVTPRDDGDRTPLSIRPSEEGRLRTLRLLDLRARRASSRGEAVRVANAGHEGDFAPVTASPGKSCGAGSSSLSVDPYGNVLPCVQWRRPVGNLHEQSMREIWSGSPALGEVRETTTEAGAMIRSAPGGRWMDFCCGLGELEKSDPLAVYDSAEEQRRLLRRLHEEAAPGNAALPVLY